MPLVMNRRPHEAILLELPNGEWVGVLFKPHHHAASEAKLIIQAPPNVGIWRSELKPAAFREVFPREFAGAAEGMVCDGV